MRKYLLFALLISVNVSNATQNDDVRLPILSSDSIEKNELSVCGLTVNSSDVSKKSFESLLIFKHPNKLLTDICKSNYESSRLVRWFDTTDYREVIFVDCKAFSLKSEFEIRFCKESETGTEWVKWVSLYNGKDWKSSKYIDDGDSPSEIVIWNSRGLNGTYESPWTKAEYSNGKLNGWVTDRHVSQDGDSLLWRFKFSNGILKYFLTVSSNDNEDDDVGELIMEGSCKNNICNLKSKNLLYGVQITRPTKVICNEDHIFSCKAIIHGLMTAHLNGKLVNSECYLDGEIFPDNECK